MKTAQLGDRAWEVEWCIDLPVDENGDTDFDRATFCTRVFCSIDAARKFAREVYPQTIGKFGTVEITPVELTDPFGDNLPTTFLWEACGESEWYTGEE